MNMIANRFIIKFGKWIEKGTRNNNNNWDDSKEQKTNAIKRKYNTSKSDTYLYGCPPCAWKFDNGYSYINGLKIRLHNACINANII